ncbi:class I SAM-dependent methyltransferase [bacterium]|nr:class I SAM-dependent methyltransferase [bacterium]
MLEFDAWQRCETAKHLIQWALPEPGARILDVGGHPGRMRQYAPDYDWVLCDPLVDAPGEQLKGGAEALPFHDGAFDFAVCLDVMEHLPESIREAAVSEMARVSKTGVLLTFPHNDTTVVAAETAVRNGYERLFGKPHPWLAEHAQCELPNAKAVSEQLHAIGGHGVIFNLGAIERWMQLQLLGLLLEEASAIDAASQIDALYRDELFAHDFKSPCYRKVVLHLFSAAQPLDLDMIDTPREDECVVQCKLYEIVHAWLESGVLSRREVKELVSDEVVASEDQTEYIRRMEDAVCSWETSYQTTLGELADAYAWRNALEQRWTFRAYRRLMRLLGKKIAD